MLLFDTYGSVNSKLQSSFLYHIEVGNLPTVSYRLTLMIFGSPSAQLESQRNGTAVRVPVRDPERSIPNLETICSTHLVLLRALDSILFSVLNALDAEMVFLRQLLGTLLAELDDDIDRDKFMRLLHRSRRLTSFQNRAKLVSASCSTYPKLSKAEEKRMYWPLKLYLYLHPRYRRPLRKF